MDGTVLILDYSAFEREKIKHILQRKGRFNIVEASAYSEYSKMLNSIGKPCLIIMDLAFPTDKDGFEILEELKRNTFFKDVPVIVITKSDSPEHKKQACKLSVKDYILKPYSPKRLEDSIASFVIPKKEFHYNIEKIKDITMTFEEYLAREFKISNRLHAPLSFILLTPVNLKGQDGTPPDDAMLEQLSALCAQSAEMIRRSLRTTDSVFLNGEVDIIIVLPGTGHAGAQTVSKKICSLLQEVPDWLPLKFSDIYYPAIVTYPQDGVSFQALMEVAFKKIADKEMLDKITSIPVGTRNLARKRYNQFRRWF